MALTKRSLKSLQVFRGRWRDWVFANHDLNFGSKVIAFALADCATMEHTLETYIDTGKVDVFPPHEYLSEKTGASPSTIQRAIAELIEYNHIECIKRGNQFVGANTYRLLNPSAPVKKNYARRAK